MWALHHDLIDSIFIIQSKEGCDQITSEMVDLGEKAMVFGVVGQIQTKFWHIHPNENLFHQSTLGTAKPFPKRLRDSQLPPRSPFFSRVSTCLVLHLNCYPPVRSCDIHQGAKLQKFQVLRVKFGGRCLVLKPWTCDFFLNEDDIHTQFPTTKMEPTKKKTGILTTEKTSHKKKNVDNQNINKTTKTKNMFFLGMLILHLSSLRPSELWRISEL